MLRYLPKTRVLLNFIMVMICSGSAECSIDPVTSPDVKFPDQMMGWLLDSRSETIGPDGLYKLIDGGAELYSAYGFKSMTDCRYHRDGEPDVEVQLYDMGSSDNAFGIFHNDCEDEEVGIGQESEYGAGWLRFRQNRFFVYLFAGEEKPEIRMMLIALGRTIAQSLPKPTPDPELMGRLPEQGLDRRLRYYVMNNQVLNRIYSLGAGDTLGLSETIPAAVGRYSEGSERAKLILVRYPNLQQCREYKERICKTLKIDSPGETPVPDKKNTWRFVSSVDRLLIIIVSSTSQDYCRSIFESVRTSLEKTP